MSDNVLILSGNAILGKLNEAVFSWRGSRYENGKIYFTEAYKLRSSLSSDEGLNNCEFRVIDRKFQGSSFAEGKTFKTLKDMTDYRCEIREYADGRRFLYFHECIPTFDSFDREWGSDIYTSIYVDNNGVNLINCGCGYKIGGIEVYLGMTRVTPAIYENLKYLYDQ